MPIFLHVGVVPLLVNMVAQMLIGAQIEKEIGESCDLAPCVKDVSSHASIARRAGWQCKGRDDEGPIGAIGAVPSNPRQALLPAVDRCA